jgi:hypothetical protein
MNPIASHRALTLDDSATETGPIFFLVAKRKIIRPLWPDGRQSGSHPRTPVPQEICTSRVKHRIADLPSPEKSCLSECGILRPARITHRGAWRLPECVTLFLASAPEKVTTRFEHRSSGAIQVVIRSKPGGVIPPPKLQS